MKILYIIYTFNRPSVVSQCIETLLNNTNIRPDELIIIDDGSDKQMQANLARFCIENSTDQLPFNLYLSGKNNGVGWSFELGYLLMKYKNPKRVFFIESDYVFRKNWAEEMLAVLDASPYTLGLSPSSHPDMYQKEKTFQLFPELMKEQFYQDVDSRQFMYSPFDLETKLGQIKCQGISNTCGSHLLDYDRLQKFIFNDLGKEKEFWYWMDRALHKWGNTDRTRASDQHISCTLSWYGNEYLTKHNIDKSKNFPLLDCCDYSWSEHLCVGGINGMVNMPIGSTFVHSPAWNPEYLARNPRNL